MGRAGRCRRLGREGGRLGASRRAAPGDRGAMANGAAPPGGDPCPGPTPGLSQPRRSRFVPAGRPVPPPALPRPPAILRRRLCLNFSGRSRRRRGVGAGPAPALAPGGIIQPPSRPEPPPYPATAWEGCGDPEPTATAGSTGHRGESRGEIPVLL
ncbi:basic proline-rich protein-like isoform X1 [Pezoporus flaviventris]|uniref:basic proline-rich protein-like isoform X1 n=1 Tax=Pezoporus flaviventris TaxID=889875 RepID=UPI002AB2B91B|nr:basic proline-rich protein-like isoform X1 [Pezoporus flaviventris]